MINTIKHIPNKFSIDKLTPYKKDEDILNQLSHIGIPLLDNEQIELENNETFIYDTDTVLYATSSSLEESYLQFYIYDKENDDFLIHHDIFVYSPINDAEYFSVNNKHYVALATCEKDIMVYDSTVFNPMAPQILLKQHNDSVLSFFSDNNTFLSGGDDKLIVEWDLEKNVYKSKYEAESKVEKLTKIKDTIFYAEKNVVKSLQLKINLMLNGNIENLYGKDNSIYLTTSTGNFEMYDIRNLSNSVFTHKYSDEALTGLHILDSNIGICSKNGDIWILNSKDFEVKNFEKIKSSLFSIKIHEDNLIFYGDESDTLQMKKMRNNVF